MQAAKIKIGTSYAVTYDNKLCAMQVTKVITTRKGSHPSDFDHIIFGRIGGIGGEELRFSPDGIHGPYEEYKELVAQKKAEEAAKVATANERKANAEALVDILYEVIDQKRPSKQRFGRNIIDVHYAGGVEIDAKGVKLLLDVLKQATSWRAVS